jgi:hypothetical protein
VPRQRPRSIIKIGVASTDWSSSIFDGRGWPVPGGANWVRFGQNKPNLTNHMVIGQLMHVGGRLGIQTFDRQNHFDCHVVIIQRYMNDWLPAAITEARRNGQVIVNDVDDWFWGLHPANRATAATNPAANPTSNIDHYRASLLASEVVTVSTPFLADAIGQWGVPTRLVTNGVTTWDFPRRIHRPGFPTIGWCGSTGHRSDDLAVVAPALRAMQGTARFHHTGDFDYHPSFATETGLDDKSVSRLPLLAPGEYPSGFCFDIGIVPLNDVVFNMAKSWIKGIEYAAAGIPFIASPSAEYKRLHHRYGIGRLAETTDEWVAHFRELSDVEVRVAEAERNRALVEEHLDARHMAKQWDELAWDLAA